MMCAMILVLYTGIAFLSFLRSSFSSALPEQTTFSSPTRTSGLAALSTTGCPVSCYRDVEPMTSITWSKKSITATITAETLLFVVNRRTNSTRTTTITNTEVDLANYTALTNTNSAGTQTTSVVVTDGNSIKTHIVVFPTNYYADYPSSYTFCGTLPTVVDGSSTCLRQPCSGGWASIFSNNTIVLPYPSHPSYVPTHVQTVSADELLQDPKGLIYEPGWGKDDLMDGEVKPLFPNLGFWKCDRGTFNAPDVLKQSALYVTATSTSTESDEGPATSRTVLHEAATTLPESWLSGSSDGLLPAPITNIEVTAAGIHPAASTGGPESRFPSTISSADVATPPANPQGSQAVKAASTITPPATARTANAPGSQGPFEPSVTELPLVLIQSSDSQGPQAATTIPKGESGPPTIPAILPNQAPTTPQPLALGTQTITPNSQHQYLLGSQTLTPNQPITLASNHIATWLLQQPSSSSPIASNPFSSPSTPTPTITPTSSPHPTTHNPLPPLILPSQTISANAQNQYIVDGQTLTPGGVVVASGTTISLAPDPTQLVVGTTTEGLGWAIIGGLGGGGGVSGGAGASVGGKGGTSSGGARERGERLEWLGRFVLIGWGVIGMVLVWWV